MTMIHGLLPEDRSDDLDAVVRAGALAAVLRALADPTRLAILAHLEGGEHTVTQLREHLGLAQSTVSQHLGVLRDAGLVATHSHGRTSVSHLARPHQTKALLDAARVLLETLSPGAQAGSAVPAVGLHAATCLSPASPAEGPDAPVPATAPRTAAPGTVTPSGAGAVLSAVTGNEAAQ